MIYILESEYGINILASDSVPVGCANTSRIHDNVFYFKWAWGLLGVDVALSLRTIRSDSNRPGPQNKHKAFLFTATCRKRRSNS